MEENIIELPVKPYIKKFLLFELEKEPIQCNQSNIAGRQLLNLLVKKSEASKVEKGLSTVRLKLSSDIADYKDALLAHALNGRAYEDYFKTAIRHFVHGSAPFLKSRKVAIELFMEKYDINHNEMNIDTWERFFHDRKTCKQTVPRKVYQGKLVKDLLEVNKRQEQLIFQMSDFIQQVGKNYINI